MDDLDRKLDKLKDLSQEELQLLDEILINKRREYVHELANNLLINQERIPHSIEGYKDVSGYIETIRNLIKKTGKI